MSRKGCKHTTPQQEDRILQLYTKYRHPRPVADELGLTIWRVTGALKRRGVKMTHTGKAGVCHRHHDRLEAMCREGASCREMGEAIGSDSTQVGRYIRRQGFWRPPHRRHPGGGSPMARNTKGPANPAWNGGRHLDKRGYVMLWMPHHPDANKHGYVREHRLMMWPLKPGQVVDHINGDPGDNRLENLRVFDSNADHLRATLTGRPCPQRGRRKPSTPAESGSGAPGSPEPLDQNGE